MDMLQEKMRIRELKGMYEIQDYLNISHMACVFILMVALVLNNNVNEVYPATRLRFIVYIGMVGIGAVLLYKYKDYYFKKNQDAASRF